MDRSEYMQRRAQIERRYRMVQRRLILYGVFAIALVMLVSVSMVQWLHLNAIQGFVIGTCGGVLGVQIANAVAHFVSDDA